MLNSIHLHLSRLESTTVFWCLGFNWIGVPLHKKMSPVIDKPVWLVQDPSQQWLSIAESIKSSDFRSPGFLWESSLKVGCFLRYSIRWWSAAVSYALDDTLHRSAPNAVYEMSTHDLTQNARKLYYYCSSGPCYHWKVEGLPLCIWYLRNILRGEHISLLHSRGLQTKNLCSLMCVIHIQPFLDICIQV